MSLDIPFSLALEFTSLLLTTIPQWRRILGFLLLMIVVLVASKRLLRDCLVATLITFNILFMD